MKRLQQDAHDPDVAAAARLLAHVPSLDDDAIRQRRVRLRMLASAKRTPLGFGKPALLLVLAVAGVAGARELGGGRWLAVSTLTRGWLGRSSGEAPPPPPRPPLSTSSSAHAASDVASVALPGVTDNAAVPEKSAALHGTRVRPAPATAPSSSTAPATAPPAASAAVLDAGAQLMVQAMQARRAGDLPRAERFLAEYRRRFPSGALAEEALALSVEMAAQRGTGLAPELARAYLARFPHGRYRPWVEQTLSAGR